MFSTCGHARHQRFHADLHPRGAPIRHLKVSVHDGRLALVKLGNSLAGVTEDLQHFGLREARLQPLVH